MRVRQKINREAGERPKYLLLVDESPEADRALSYAVRRSLKLDCAIVLLAAINPDDYKGHHLFGVGEAMRQEAIEKAQEQLNRAEMRLKRMGLERVEYILKEGKTGEALAEVIESDTLIVALVLAAGTGHDGSGPVVSALAKNAGHFSIPIIIIPGRMSDEEIEAIT